MAPKPNDDDPDRERTDASTPEELNPQAPPEADISALDDLMAGFSPLAQADAHPTPPAPPQAPDPAGDLWAVHSRADLIAMFQRANGIALARAAEVEHLKRALVAQQQLDIGELEKQLAEKDLACEVRLTGYTTQVETYKTNLQTHYAGQQQKAVAAAIIQTRKTALEKLDETEYSRKQAVTDAQSAIAKAQLFGNELAKATRLLYWSWGLMVACVLIWRLRG